MNSSATQPLPICTKTSCKKEEPKMERERINLEGTLPVHKPMLRKEVMQFYGIQSYTTLAKILKPIHEQIGNKQRRLFFSPQLRIIREFMDGVPVEY